MASSPASLLSLAREIRDMIYDFTVTHDDSNYVPEAREVRRIEVPEHPVPDFGRLGTPIYRDRESTGRSFHLLPPDAAYVGLLLANRQISAEVREIIRRKRQGATEADRRMLEIHTAPHWTQRDWRELNSKIRLLDFPCLSLWRLFGEKDDDNEDARLAACDEEFATETDAQPWILVWGGPAWQRCFVDARLDVKMNYRLSAAFCEEAPRDSAERDAIRGYDSGSPLPADLWRVLRIAMQNQPPFRRAPLTLAPPWEMQALDFVIFDEESKRVTKRWDWHRFPRERYFWYGMVGLFNANGDPGDLPGWTFQKAVHDSVFEMIGSLWHPTWN